MPKIIKLNGKSTKWKKVPDKTQDSGSTAIKCYGYFAMDEKLVIEFKDKFNKKGEPAPSNGTKYEFDNISYNTYKQFTSAESMGRSMGKYYNKKIKAKK
jgi:hypothetical protein